MAYQKPHLLNVLASYSADFEATNAQQASAYGLACYQGNIEALKILIRMGVRRGKVAESFLAEHHPETYKALHRWLLARQWGQNLDDPVQDGKVKCQAQTALHHDRPIHWSLGARCLPCLCDVEQCTVSQQGYPSLI